MKNFKPCSLFSLSSLVLLPLFGGLLQAATHEISTESLFGSEHYTQGISYDGRARPLLWGAGFNYEESSTKDATTSAEISNQTYDFTGRFGYSNIYRAIFSAHYALTPDENLHNPGAKLSLGKRWDLGSSSSADEFKPYLSLSLSFGVDYFVQTFSSSSATSGKRRTNRATRTANNQIFQESPGIQANLAPYDFLSLLFVYRYSFYSKSVSNFLSSFDNTQSFNRKSASATRSGPTFVDHALSLDMSLYFFDDWEFLVTAHTSRSVDLRSWSKVIGGGVNYEFPRFLNLGLSYEKDFSLSSDTQTMGVQVAFRL